MEVYVLVERKKNMVLQFISTFLMIAGVVTIVLAFVGFFMFLPFAVVEIAVGYFLHKRYNEYEYSYFDGDIRFAKIINKSKRKALKGYSMEDVLVLAPIDDRSVYNYLNDSNVKVRNLTSGKPNRRIYAIVVRSEGTELVKFEPDDKYLDAVCIKYGQKVVR